MRLKNKVAIITGAASGMGRASAVRFAQEGAKVVVADRTVKEGEETVDLIKKAGGEAVFVECDVTSQDMIKNTIQTAVDQYGKIDILMNNAGCPQMTQKYEDISDEEWARIYAVNVTGTRWFTKFALPYLRESGNGSIINVSSVGGSTVRPGSSAYSTSKGAVITLTKAMAIEFASDQIRVNCILPGPTDTPMMSKFVIGYDDPDKHDTIKAGIGGSTPLGRFVQPEDIANAALFFASDEASAITGVLMQVDCGSMLGGRKA